MATKKASAAAESPSRAVGEGLVSDVKEILAEANGPVPVSLLQRLIRGSQPTQSDAAKAGKELSRLIAQSLAGVNDFAVVLFNNVEHLTISTVGDNTSQIAAKAMQAMVESTATKEVIDASSDLKAIVEAAMKGILSSSGGCMPLRTLKARIGDQFPQMSDMAEIICVSLAFNDPDFRTTNTSPLTVCLA